MSSSPVVPDDAKDQFWSVVRDCLREFHKMSADASRRKTSQLHKKVDSMPTQRMELFYHSEPFDVACDLANQPMNLEEHLDRYIQIRDEEAGDHSLKSASRRPGK